NPPPIARKHGIPFTSSGADNHVPVAALVPQSWIAPVGDLQTRRRGGYHWILRDLVPVHQVRIVGICSHSQHLPLRYQAVGAVSALILSNERRACINDRRYPSWITAEPVQQPSLSGPPGVGASETPRFFQCTRSSDTT